MPQGTVEDIALSPLSQPYDRYFRALDPGMRFSVKSGLGEHRVGGVNVHVILLRLHSEVLQAFGDGGGKDRKRPRMPGRA